MKRIFILISMLWCASSVGQNKTPDSLWLAKSRSADVMSDFQEGYNTFFLDSLSNFPKYPNNWEQLMKTERKILLIENARRKKAENFFLDSVPTSKNLFELSEDNQVYLLERNQFNLFHFTKDSINETELCRDFNIVTTDSLNNRQEIDDFLENLLYKKGVVPDVITAPGISDIEYLKKQFYKEPVYRARVTFNGEDLNRVSWKEFPHLKTCGIFRTSDSTLTPQKRGYMFSPDIYNFTDKNTKISGPKNFRAIRYELYEELKYSLSLSQNFTNRAHNETKSTATDVEFVTDSGRGEVAYFNGSSSYIDIRSQDEDNLEEISITAWIKPDEVNGSLSLIGKGEAYSAKIYHGRLQFTATGIKDHNTSDQIIETDEWSHIAFVFVPRQKVYFYLNGKLIEEIPASNIRQTDHALLIGTNLWGQYYSGLLSDVKIWSRALSNKEVENIFIQKEITANGGGSSFWIWMAVFFLLLVLILVLILKNKKAKSVINIKTPKTSKPLFEGSLKENGITLLNGFKILNNKGKDITHQFSPKRRELLILILLYTIKEGGISSRKMSEILWPGFPAKSQKNNRSTQIKEIRKILENQVPVEIIFIDKKWQVETSASVKIDIFSLEEFIPGFLSASKPKTVEKETILNFSRIVSRGPLLPQLEMEWLDKIKSDYNNSILDLLTPYIEDPGAFSNSECMEIIDAVLVIDPLYEVAVRKKVDCLLKDGKHMSAKKVVEDYKKLYESFYGEPADAEFLK